MIPHWTITLLGPLLYLAAAILAFEAIRRARTPQGAVGWTVFLFAWPIVAVPLYLLFGYARVQSMPRLGARRTEPAGRVGRRDPSRAEEAARLAECGRCRSTRCHAGTR